MKLGLGLLISIGGPLGAPLFVYAVILALNESQTGDFHIIEGISKATSFVEGLFESLPQIVIQTVNNLKNDDLRDPFASVSIGVSALGICFTLYKLCYSIDKMQQFDTGTSMKVQPEAVELNINTEKNKEMIIEDIQEED